MHPFRGMGARKPLHVVPFEAGWAVRRGPDRLCSRHRSEEEASEEARRIAREERDDVEIVGRRGEIREDDRSGDPRAR